MTAYWTLNYWPNYWPLRYLMMVARTFVANFIGSGSVKISGVAKSLLSKVLTYRGTGNVKTSGTVNLTGLPVGTLSSPPSGLNIGDMWLDTTTSSQYPIVRVRAT